MKRKTKLAIVITAAVLVVLGGTVIARRGQVLAENAERSRVPPTSGDTRTGRWSRPRGPTKWLKVIVANPTMIKANKAGVPGNGSLFRKAPRSRAPVELQEEHGGPFVVDVPNAFTQLSSWRRTASDFRKAEDGDTRYSTTKPHPTSHGRSQSLGLWTHVPRCREGQGLHLPPVPEAVNGSGRGGELISWWSALRAAPSPTLERRSW